MSPNAQPRNNFQRICLISTLLVVRYSVCNNFVHNQIIRSCACFALMFASDDDEQLWVWEYETDDGSHDLFMDANEPIRFRVIDEEFIDMTPSGPMLAGNTETTETAEKKKAPYRILVSF